MELMEASTLVPVTSPPESLIKFCILWTVLQSSKPPKVCNSVLYSEDYHHDQEAIDKVLTKHHGLLKRLQKYNNNNNADDILDPDSAITRADGSPFQFHFKHSSRSLSVIGVLGGIVLVLFFVALSTCIKHRRNVNGFGDRYHHRENLAREMLVDHIRQLRSNYRSQQRQIQADRPPAYEDVVKDSNEDVPDGAEGGVGLSSQQSIDDCEEPPSYVEATNSDEYNATTIVTLETTVNNSGTSTATSNAQ